MSVRAVSYFCQASGKRRWAKFHRFAQRGQDPIAILERPSGEVFIYRRLSKLRFLEDGFRGVPNGQDYERCSACIVFREDTGAPGRGWFAMEYRCILPFGHEGPHESDRFNRGLIEGYRWLSE
jgi:hypothetical protein